MFNRDIYLDEKAPAFVLLTATLKKYGTEALEYDPELLRQQIDRDYDIKIPDLNMDKLQAAMTVIHTNSFYDDWRVFETCCHLFHNALVDASVVNPLDAEDIAVGLAEATLLKSCVMDDESELKFSDEIRAYSGHIFWDYGLSTAPFIFRDAIMPHSPGSAANDPDKNQALRELFDHHTVQIVDYLEKMQ